MQSILRNKSVVAVCAAYTFVLMVIAYTLQVRMAQYTQPYVGMQYPYWTFRVERFGVEGASASSLYQDLKQLWPDDISILYVSNLRGRIDGYSSDKVFDGYPEVSATVGLIPCLVRKDSPFEKLVSEGILTWHKRQYMVVGYFDETSPYAITVNLGVVLPIWASNNYTGLYDFHTENTDFAKIVEETFVSKGYFIFWQEAHISKNIGDLIVILFPQSDITLQRTTKLLLFK